MKVKLDSGAKISKAHRHDAGIDIHARETKTIPANGSAVFDSGVHIAIPMGYCGLLVSKSGLNVKHGLNSTGLIDSGYTGSLCVKLYNHSNEDYTVLIGEKISQLVILPFSVFDIEFVDELDETERGNNGFGSTGR